MNAANQRDFVNGNEIIVTLIPGNAEASISVGKPGSPSFPAHVSIQPFLDAGLDEREALKRVLAIACIAVRGAVL